MKHYGKIVKTFNQFKREDLLTENFGVNLVHPSVRSKSTEEYLNCLNRELGANGLSIEDLKMENDRGNIPRHYRRH